MLVIIGGFDMNIFDMNLLAFGVEAIVGVSVASFFISQKIEEIKERKQKEKYLSDINEAMAEIANGKQPEKSVLLVPSDSGELYAVSAYDLYLQKYPGAVIPESALPPVKQEEPVVKEEKVLYLSPNANFFCIYQALMQKCRMYSQVSLKDQEAMEDEISCLSIDFIDCFDNAYWNWHNNHLFAEETMANEVSETKVQLNLFGFPTISMDKEFNQLYQSILLKQIQYEDATVNDQKRINKEIVSLVGTLLSYINRCYYEQNHKSLEEDIAKHKFDPAMCSLIGCKDYCYLNQMDTNFGDSEISCGESRKKQLDFEE